jgi:hypothetical protein
MSTTSSYTYQGLDDNTTWARGQSWAVYGMAAMYNETGTQPFVQKTSVFDLHSNVMLYGPAPGSGQQTSRVPPATRPCLLWQAN